MKATSKKVLKLTNSKS